MTAATLVATIRLGTKLSVGAVMLAVAMSLVGDVTQWSYVTAVAVVGAVLSWHQSGRHVSNPVPGVTANRVTR